MHMSSYYLGEDDFSHAEHCLLAAAHVLPPKEDEQADANMNLATGNFWLQLLQYSKDYIMKKYQDPETEEANLPKDSQQILISPKTTMPDIEFDSILPIQKKRSFYIIFNYEEVLFYKLGKLMIFRL
jgi:hypothetical protein